MIAVLSVAVLVTMKAYHIKQWNTLYETASTRQVRTLTYYSKPIKFVGECIGHLFQQVDGLALYGTWTFVLESLAASATHDWRRWLIRNGTPLDAQRMSALTRVPQKDIERAIEFFSTPPMDWLENIEWPGQAQLELPARHQTADGTPMADRKSVV